MSSTIAAAHPWVAEGMQRVRFGVNTMIPPDWAAARDLAQMIEGLGYDTFLTPDHPLTTTGGCWTPLAAIAEATRTIRLGTLVSCVYYWNPVVLARAVTDVDRISGGRVVLGLGSGDMPHEFRQLGLPFPSTKMRQAALEDALRIIRPLLRGEEVSYQGVHFQANGAALRPAPVQQPYVPILVAGGGERTTLRFVAEYADASNLGAASWAGGAFTPDDTRRKFAVLREHCAAVGRSDDSVLRTGVLSLFLAESHAAAQAKLDRLPPMLRTFFQELPFVGTPEEAVDRVRALVDVGFRYIIFGGGTDPESMRLAAERVIPAVLSGL